MYFRNIVCRRIGGCGPDIAIVSLSKNHLEIFQMWFRWEIGVRASSLRTSAYDGENVGPKAMKCVPLSLFNFIKGLATNFTKKFHNYTTKLITKRKKNVAEQCDMNAKHYNYRLIKKNPWLSTALECTAKRNDKCQCRTWNPSMIFLIFRV